MTRMLLFLSESYLEFSFYIMFISFMTAYLCFKCILIKIPSTLFILQTLDILNYGTFFSIISWHTVFLSSSSLSYPDNAFEYVVELLNLSSVSLKINVSQLEIQKKISSVLASNLLNSSLSPRKSYFVHFIFLKYLN